MNENQIDRIKALISAIYKEVESEYSDSELDTYCIQDYIGNIDTGPEGLVFPDDSPDVLV